MRGQRLLPRGRKGTGSKESNARQRCRFLPIAHHSTRLSVPIEIRPHVCTALAAGAADKPPLNIGQPKIIRPGSPLLAMKWLHR